MQSTTLVGYQKGIDRTRTRAVAKDGTFYDLVNCYATTGGTLKKRPGFRHVAALDSNTKGLFSAGGKLHTFYSVDSVTEVAGFQYNRLAPRTPVNSGDEAPSLTKVNYAGLYLGGLYVAAEMDDVTLPHYWLKAVDAWQAGTVYLKTDMVRPTVSNGYYYTPTTTDNPQAWASRTSYALGDSVQPITYNGYKYTVTAIDGDGVSGSTEPMWIASEGAVIYEDVTTTAQPVDPNTNAGVPGGDRYNNLPGYKNRQIGRLGDL